LTTLLNILLINYNILIIFNIFLFSIWFVKWIYVY